MSPDIGNTTRRRVSHFPSARLVYTIFVPSSHAAMPCAPSRQHDRSFTSHDGRSPSRCGRRYLHRAQHRHFCAAAAAYFPSPRKDVQKIIKSITDYMSSIEIPDRNATGSYSAVRAMYFALQKKPNIITFHSRLDYCASQMRLHTRLLYTMYH